jgi:hypothetical protein
LKPQTAAEIYLEIVSLQNRKDVIGREYFCADEASRAALSKELSSVDRKLAARYKTCARLRRIARVQG